MKTSFPILSMLWLAALAGMGRPAAGQQPPMNVARATPPAAVTPSPPKANAAPPAVAPAQALLQNAIRTLENRQSVSAKIRQVINLYNKELVGSGTYVEQRPGVDHYIRLELKIQLGDEVTSLLQVCDGQTLWTYRKLLGDPTISRIDAPRAFRAIEEAEEVPGRGNMGMLPGLGGLPRVLRGLDAVFDFTSLEKGRLERTPVWILRGQWRPAYLVRVLPKQKAAIEQGKPVNLEKLPAHLPDQVILLLGQEDLFPYRTEYHRWVPEKSREAGQPESRPLVIMDIFQVSFNEPPDASRFTYHPPTGVICPDQTQAFIDSLKRPSVP